MNKVYFLLIALYLAACGQHPEPWANTQFWPTVRSALTVKPKPANKFVQDILANKKLLNDNDKLERKIEQYIKRGGNLNIRLDSEGNTMLTKVLRAEQRSFALLLVAHHADKDRALRVMLDLYKPSPNPSPQDWPIITWLINQGASKNLLDKYVHEAIQGPYFFENGVKQAIKLGADTEQAFTVALENKAQDGIDLMLDYVDEQQAFDEVLRANDIDIIQVFLKVKLNKDNLAITDEDTDRLLVKALREDNEDLFHLAQVYGGRILRVLDNALQEENYDTLELVVRELSHDDLEGVLFKVLQTKNDKIVDLLLGRFDDKKVALNYTLGNFSWRGNYDLAEYIVGKGGDADLVLESYLHDIDRQSVRTEFDPVRIQKIVELGAAPQKLNLKRITHLVMYDIVERAPMIDKDIEVLKFLFANMAEKSIAELYYSRKLLQSLVAARQHRIAELTKQASNHGIDVKFYLLQEEHQSLSKLQDGLISLLKQYNVPLEKE